MVDLAGDRDESMDRVMLDVAGSVAGVGVLGTLPVYPMDPMWIEASAASTHGDGRAVGALVRLLLAAWRSSTPGAIPADDRTLANLTRESVDYVASVRHILLAEFELCAKTHVARHTGVAQRVEGMQKRFGPQIADFALNCSMAAVDPSFGLVKMEAVRGRVRGLTLLPSAFGLDSDPSLRDWCVHHGYVSVPDQVWVMDRFISRARSSKMRSGDWISAFQDFALAEAAAGRLPPGAGALGAGQRASGAFARARGVSDVVEMESGGSHGRNR